jgi:hypothetical protein
MKGARIVAILVALAAAAILGAAPATAQVGQDEAAGMVAETYGVEVLKTEEGEVDGQPVWLVTVMEPGGNTNSAFRVATLAVSKETGQLVPAFRHRSSGYRLPGGEAGVPRSADRPLNMQQGIWR